jgi:hypothetical protein
MHTQHKSFKHIRQIERERIEELIQQVNELMGTGLIKALKSVS